jgi:hypothetical protein
MAPEEAQDRFRRDIAPQLYRAAGFRLYKQKPGLLAFSDLVRDPDNPLPAGRHSPIYEKAAWTSRHIRVRFAAEAPGTRVTIKGRASRRIRDALLLLGEPEQWPQRRPAG